MAGHNEKRRQLDDEMSRFEAEISGPTPSHLQNIDSRQIIGSNTFAQMKHQLRQGNDDTGTPLQPPPNFVGPALQRPPVNAEPPGSNQRRHGGGGGPSASFRPGPFPPPPMPPPPFPPPQANNFRPSGPPPPPPPPGFIPPQIRSLNNGGSMGNISMNAGSRHLHPPFLRPPPPPPGLVGGPRMSIGPNINGPRMSPGPNINGPSPHNPVIISKPPKPVTVITSAPKLYAASHMKETDECKMVKALVLEPFKPEQKKSKLKIEVKKLNTSSTRAKDKSQAQKMAEKVRQSITTIKQPSSNQTSNKQHPPNEEKKKEKKSRKNLRYAGGQVWEDANLAEWDPDDFRMFAGDLGNDVTDDLLLRHFSHYPSFVKAKVVRDKRTNKSKGYGFISFNDPQDYIRAMKEMNGKYLGSRPIKLRKSMWRDRNLDNVQKKQKEKQLLGLK